MPMFGAMQDPYDKPFQRWTDLKAFTWALVFAGYRPYELHRQDNGLMQEVWAKDELEVQDYAPGTVVKLTLVPGYTVQPPIVVVLDREDGGHVNVNGTHIPCLTCMGV